MTPLELAAQLHDPETRQPFVLLPAERRFLEHAFLRTSDGRLRYPEQVYACPKKSGKTTFAALHTLITTLLFGGSYPEATVLANDLEQARGRVFEMCRRIVECSPLLKRDARVSADLQRAGVKMVEYPQSSPNLTASSQNLYELIKGRNLVVYPDANIRLAISRAVAIESARGWRIAKDKQAHRIDVVIALAMAALAAIQQQSRYDSSLDWVFGATTPATAGADAGAGAIAANIETGWDNDWQRQQYRNYVTSGGYRRF